MSWISDWHAAGEVLFSADEVSKAKTSLMNIQDHCAQLNQC